MSFAGLSNNRILEAMSLTDPGKAFILKRKSQVYFNLPLYWFFPVFTQKSQDFFYLKR